MNLPSWQLMIAAGLAAVLITGAVLIAIIPWLMRRRRVPAEPSELFAPISVADLGEQGPEGLQPRLTLYHQPVRLALIIIAPAGRDSRLPSSDEMPQVVEAIVPGLMEILTHHRPEYRPWPPQLSTAGFASLFAKHVPLPGRRGKGTPWASVAGPFEYNDQRFLAGVVVHAASNNSLGELAIEHPGQWLDLLRVQ